MGALTRPALRYLGGKWKLAPWIIEHFPPHRLYVEPFGGAASVLLRKPRSMGECYNDLYGEVVNLFRVLRDPERAAGLANLIGLTPFSREEYDAAFLRSEDNLERARRLVVRSYMGHGSSAAVKDKSTGFRASMVNRGGALPAGDWVTVPPALLAISERLQGVVIESRPALQVAARYDAADTLIYLDPPYIPSTRSAKRKDGAAAHAYAHEMTAQDHDDLLAFVRTAKSMIVISGYPSEQYDRALEGWRREQIDTHADGALDRVEVIWINPAASAALDAIAHPDLFGAAA